MDDQYRIQELQKRINDLATQLQDYRERLIEMQRELNLLRNKNEVADDPIAAAKPGESSGFENYIGLRFMHIAGIVVLVTGLSIGVKYAIDKELISEAMRIMLAYAAGVILFFLSVRLKAKYHLFSAILFSGSMASVYFTTYAAFVYYSFFPGWVAFVIMALLTAYTVIMAISYNRQEIAVLGMIGAYGIPFLISTNSERFDLFFSYILLINIGVVVIAFRRSWRLMQYLALLITWILFTGWGFIRHDPADQMIAVVFMAAYYILFMMSASASRFGRSHRLLPGDIQQVIINNTALYVASLLVFSNGGFQLLLASVTGFMSLYIVLLAVVTSILMPGEIVLQRLLAWQGIILLISFIGMRWDGLTVTLLWIATAVLLFVWGIFNKKSWPRLISILLIGLTLAKLIIFDSASFSTVQKIISFLVIGVLLLLFSFYYQKFNLLNKPADHEM